MAAERNTKTTANTAKRMTQTDGGRPETPPHLRTKVVSLRLPQWVIDWMDAHEETQGHLMREAVIEYYGLRPPAQPHTQEATA